MKRHIITLVFLYLSLQSFAQNTYVFNLKPAIGKTLNAVMSVKTDVDGPQSFLMDMKMKMAMTPVQQEGENITLETVAKAVKVDMNAGMVTMSYNSEEEPQDEMGKMLAEQFSKIVNQTITVVLSPKGKPLDIKLPEALSQSIDENAFSNFSTPLPEEAISPGSSWENSAELPDNPFIAKTVLTSTFREENTEGYVIDIVGKLLDDTESEIGTITGNYILDKKTLFTKNSQLKTTLESQGIKISSDVDLVVQ